MKRFWMKKLPSALLALVLVIGLMPSAAAASVAKTYEVDEDDSVWLDADDFQDIYEDMTYNGDLEYISFTSYDDFDDYGYFTFTDFDDYDYDDVDYDELGDHDFYYDYYNTDADEDDIDLDTLKFVAYDDVDSASLDFTFKMYGDEGTKTATICIEVEGGSSSSSKGGSFSYKVSANSSVDLDEDDFISVFKKEYNNSPRYVVFDTPSSSAYANGSIYYRSTSFSRTELRNYEFYIGSNSDYGDYPLDSLSFDTTKSFKGEVELTFTVYYSSSRSVSGTVVFSTSGKGSSSSKGDITIDVDVNDEVTLDADEFWDLFDDETYYDEELYSLEFTDYDDFDDYGYFYAAGYDDDGDYDDEYELNDSDLDDAIFYYKSRYATDDYEFELDTLTFVTYKNADEGSLKFEFTMTGDDDEEIEGTLVINIGDGDGSSVEGDITYKADANDETTIDVDHFDDYVKSEAGKSYSLKRLIFTDSENLTTANGSMYDQYGSSKNQTKFTASSLEDATFYVDEDDIPSKSEDCYLLEDLSFVASRNFDSYVSLDFRAYYNSSKYVTGTLVFSNKTGGSNNNSASSYYVGNIRYSTTTNQRVQINANDIARYFKAAVPGYTMQYVLLGGVPSTGTLYYNYYNTSKYGSATRAQITAANCSGQVFYASPSATDQFALTELTYVPSGTNYCAAIPFTAYGSGRSVTGAILISVTSAAVAEVYGPTPRNTPVKFPASSIYSAVLNATGQALTSIQLLSLPSATAGSVYLSGSYTPANTTTQYYYSGSGKNTISQLQFLPATNFTGSVEIPYVALNSSGTAIAAGTFSLGVVSSEKKFSDVSSSTWCYKYVTELSAANVIAGYTNGTFKPDSAVTYGAALKLIMLAAGYPEQAPTVASQPFSGYLAKARADGLVTRSSIDLTKPITRLQVAQLAAGALKLSTSGLSSVKPFTDTADVSVQALNAAGIVEGYFANGTSTFKPGNTLTRGQISAIVWRMNNYRK